MKVLKWVIVAVVVLYALWIAFPVIKAYVLPTDMSGNVPMMSQDDNDFSGGGNVPMDGDAGAPVTDSIQGDTAIDALVTHNTPVVVLWGGVIILYLAAAFLHANGNIQAAGAYLVGFAADLILTYVINGNRGGGLWDKVLNVLSGWDPRYVLTLVAMVLGFMIYAMQSKKPLPKFINPKDLDLELP